MNPPDRPAEPRRHLLPPDGGRGCTVAVTGTVSDMTGTSRRLVLA